MQMKKCAYIHFETKPTYEKLSKYFSKYPGYKKVFATSYQFSVDRSVPHEHLHDWVAECFPVEAYVLCIGSINPRDELLDKLIYHERSDIGS